MGESNDYLPKMIELEKKEIKMKEIDALAEEQEIDVSLFKQFDSTPQYSLSSLQILTKSTRQI